MKLLLILSVLTVGGTLAKFVSTPERVRGYGYPVEEHTVQTSDGYILRVFRIPYSPRSNNQFVSNKPIVFLMHGLMVSSDCWLLSGPENSIAFLLADAGYDVWLGNARGNVYSKKHVSLSPLSPQFWDFEWHQIALKDLPAMIDYILLSTKQQSLHYIGHSQGTTVYMVLLSSLPSYNSKIKSANLFAPVGYMEHITSPLAPVLAPLLGSPLIVNELLGETEFAPSNALISMLAPEVCVEKSLFTSMCSSVLFLICGWDSVYINETMLPAIYETSPAGSSTKQVLHYLQEYNSGDFRQYDHGWFLNFIKYGSFSPPQYRLENIKPLGEINLFYGSNDYLSAVEDVHRLPPRFGGKTNKYLVKYPEYNHMDLIWAINVKQVINDCVIDKINAYEGYPVVGDTCNNFL